MANSEKKRGLGRGLSALMSDVAETDHVDQAAASRPDRNIPIEKIHPNPDQPRKRFSQEDLDDLASSIKKKGVIQPLIVRPKGEGYEIVAGERRWRAAQQAQLHELPAIVRDFDDAEVLEIAIIENIQRSDLNPVEEAAGYKQLMDKFGYTQEKLAEDLGKSRSHIANQMRLLALPEEVLALLEVGKISAGHARALITVPNAVELAKKIVAGGLSVRDTEKLVKKAGMETTAPKRAIKVATKDADTRALEDDLSAATGMKVVLAHKAGEEGGAMTVHYNTLEELDELCRRLSAS